MSIMRAKMVVKEIIKHSSESEPSITLSMSAVCKSDSYPDDGSDEDNTFARFTPTADLTMVINNPNLIDKFKIGKKFYVNFTSAK